MKRLFSCLAICYWGASAIAATCEPNYYLENGECIICNQTSTRNPSYCPGDDIRYPCPTTDTDYEKLSGWTMTMGREAAHVLDNATDARACRSSMRFIDSHGNMVLVECTFNGDNYWCKNWLWYSAAAGFYLTDYIATSWEDWYRYVKPCTNAPANAHYTGPGTPDAKDGSMVDANDCPWACDAGFGKSVSDECLPLCDAGITKISANTVSVPLFNEKHTSPALAVEYAGRVCYADLVLGAGRPAINIDYHGQVYHTVNQ